MNQRYHNPFASVDLLAPIGQQELYKKYCQRGSSLHIDQSPFPRMIDFWFAGFSIAARNKMKYMDLHKNETFKFNDGSIFDRDSWRIQMIMLVVMTVTDDVEVLANPNQIISVANGLAAVGVPLIEQMLSCGDQTPIWNLSDGLVELLENSN